MPDQDDYPAALATIVAHLVSGDRDEAERLMADIAYTRREVARRPAIGPPLKVRVHRRDHWTCRYCGRKVILYPVMHLLGLIFPDQFPHTPNWKGGQTHPAVAACSSAVDHKVPGSQGGAWLAEDNLVTACAPCNAAKADFTLEQLGWQLRPIALSSWDGLSGSYRDLWQIAGSPQSEAHPRWLKAIG
jgi:5-methylcytosine-specific restriction endonuclease McrA